MTADEKLTRFSKAREKIVGKAKGSEFPLVLGFLAYVISFLLGILSLTTRSSSEDWVPLIDGNSDPLAFPTICSLALLKRVNFSSAVNYSSYNYESSSWYNMTWILDFIYVTSLIHTSGSEALLLIIVENISSNTT